MDQGKELAKATAEYFAMRHEVFQFVRYAIHIGALELVPEGRKLKSGRISPYFFNSGLFTTGDALARLAGAYVPVVYKCGERPDVLFGPAYKGIPLVAAIAVTLGNSIEFAFNRKEEKQHGDGGLIVGASLRGKKVLIVDDVITDGASKREAVDIIRAQGGTPIGCVVAFDRQEKGFDKETQADKSVSAAQEFEQMFGVPLVAAATLSDLIAVLESRLTDEHDMFDVGPILDKIFAYHRQYGVDV